MTLPENVKISLAGCQPNFEHARIPPDEKSGLLVNYHSREWWISSRLDKIKERIARAAIKSSRNPADITLLAVTKNATIAEISQAISLGIKVIGENKVKVAAEKFSQLDLTSESTAKSKLINKVKSSHSTGGSHLSLIRESKCTAPTISEQPESERRAGHLSMRGGGREHFDKHLIGHLQTNKVKEAVKLFDTIQSVDSLKLAKEINKRATELQKVMPIMIEINISGETQKYGIPPETTAKFYQDLSELPYLKVVGLMAIAPDIPAEETRPYFQKMKQLFDQFNLKWLSLGMTNDYEIAIEEGSNMVRIGTALFGK